MKIIICGSNDFSNYNRLRAVCNHLLKGKDVEVGIASTKGVGRLTELYVKEKQYETKRFVANHNGEGRSALANLNREMTEYADEMIVFWNRADINTRNLIDQAKRKGVTVHIITYINDKKEGV